MPADEIRNLTGRNAMLAFPYTKRHCSQWNVNHGVAIIVSSLATAEALGLDRRRWIFPVAAAESRHVVVLAQQRQLHSHAGSALRERCPGARRPAARRSHRRRVKKLLSGGDPVVRPRSQGRRRSAR
ncbi:MAG: hypothetical protein U0802_24625 [Candidatus Binatia bacterium]